jgi:hypothetical protein
MVVRGADKPMNVRKEITLATKMETRKGIGGG